MRRTLPTTVIIAVAAALSQRRGGRTYCTLEPRAPDDCSMKGSHAGSRHSELGNVDENQKDTSKFWELLLLLLLLQLETSTRAWAKPSCCALINFGWRNTLLSWHGEVSAPLVTASGRQTDSRLFLLSFRLLRS